MCFIGMNRTLFIGRTSLPKFAPRSEEEAYLDAAREYLESLAAIRTLKSTGPFPVFPKRHRSGVARALRTGFILGVQGIHVAARGKQAALRIRIPDLISARSRQDARIAIKSVSLLPYVRLLARAWPQSRILVIVRHPCGQVASIMRGVELGKLIAVPFTNLAKSDEAERLGLKVEDLSALSTVEQLAWEWAFSNERMLREIDGLNNVKMVVYEDLAADPVNVARSLFEFADLAWDPQVERFIRDSTQHHETRFYSLNRNPLYAANRWREALTADEQRRISRDCFAGGDRPGVSHALAPTGALRPFPIRRFRRRADQSRKRGTAGHMRPAARSSRARLVTPPAAAAPPP